MAEAPRKWLITGVSSGLGRAIAEKALARGDIVAGTLRKPEQFEDFAALARGRAIPIALDVTDDAGVGPAVATAIAAAGGLDILVNNAGYALMGPIEDIGLPEARREIETNFFGVLKLSQAVLPHFRAQNAGRIINIGSVASVVGFPMNGIYSASKFAVAGFSEALAKECAAFGVKVTCVETGRFSYPVWSRQSCPPIKSFSKEYACGRGDEGANGSLRADRSQRSGERCCGYLGAHRVG